MGNFRVIAKEVKEDSIRRIKEEGKSVKEVAEQVGVDRRTVYGWLSKGVAKETNIIKLNRLKRENQFLVSLVGRLKAKELFFLLQIRLVPGKMDFRNHFMINSKLI